MSARILVVEDEPAIRAALEFNLSKHGFEVCCVASVQEALMAMGRFQPQVVLADGGLPDASGVALATFIRREEGCRGIRIVAMSGDPDQEQLFRAMPDRYDAFLQKPFSTDELVEVLERLLRR